MELGLFVIPHKYLIRAIDGVWRKITFCLLKLYLLYLNYLNYLRSNASFELIALRRFHDIWLGSKLQGLSF